MDIIEDFTSHAILRAFDCLLKKHPEKHLNLHIIDGFNNDISKKLREYVHKNNLVNQVFFYPFLDFKDLIASKQARAVDIFVQ